MTTKRGRPKKQTEPTYRVEPAGKRDIMQHDIVLLADMHGFTVYIDPEVQIVLTDIIQRYGKVAVKINWGSPDLQLFVERSLEQDVTEFVETVNTLAKDAAAASQETES